MTPLFPSTHTVLSVRLQSPWSCQVYGCVCARPIVLLLSLYVLHLTSLCNFYVNGKNANDTWLSGDLMSFFWIIIPTTSYWLHSLFRVSALWLSPLSTDAPRENKASSRLCSPAVIGWDRPNLRYKYPTMDLYLVRVPLWREAQFCQRRWVRCVIPV